jgi:CRISPR-associated protein Cas1
MSHHIVHLISPQLRVRVKLDQLRIEDTEKGSEQSVPLSDISVIISASPDLTVTANALRRMAELNILFIVCNEKFEPSALTVPYHKITDEAVLRGQIASSPEWKAMVWRRIVTVKIQNQASVLQNNLRAKQALMEVARHCANGQSGELSKPAKTSIASVTASQRHLYYSSEPAACESRAARIYWRRLFHQWGKMEARRLPGTRSGINGMLDYGYAIMRTAVLRSLAAHGFIAAIGIHHTSKPGGFPLADDLMEPLRPWVDAAVSQFLQDGNQEGDMKTWSRTAAAILTSEIPWHKRRVRLLNAIDLYTQSLQRAVVNNQPALLELPQMP